MSKIEVQVIDQAMAFKNMPVIASGDVNADIIKFAFSSEWDGYTGKTCTFYQQKGAYFYALLNEDDEAVIPSGALKNPGIIYFGISAYNAGTTLTTNVLAYEILEGAYTEVDPEEGRDLLGLIHENVTEMREEFDGVVDSLAYLRLTGDNEFQYNDDVMAKILTTCQNIYTKAITFSTGSYSGDGAERQITLTLDFCPKLLIVYGSSGLCPSYSSSSAGKGWHNSFLWCAGMQNVYMHGRVMAITANGKTISWNASEPSYMCNDSGETYRYICFGTEE